MQRSASLVNKVNLDGTQLPRLAKRKKKAVHTKNPFKVKKYLIPGDEVIKAKKLDGFLLLKMAKSELPHEVLRANLSSISPITKRTENSERHKWRSQIFHQSYRLGCKWELHRPWRPGYPSQTRKTLHVRKLAVKPAILQTSDLWQTDPTWPLL